MADHSESRLHIAVVDYLRGEIRNGKNVIKVQRPFDCLFLHPVNEFRDEKEAFWGTRKGILPGAGDLLFWWDSDIGRTLCGEKTFPKIECGSIELKTTTGLTPRQKDFKAKFEDIGGKHAVCKTVAAVRDTLISWGLHCKNTNVIEPRLSDDELKKRYMNMQKP
jgi:hypothetical protein